MNHPVNLKFLPFVAAVCGFFSAVDLNGEDKSFPVSDVELTYHVEVYVETTHVSENTTSGRWRNVLSTSSETLAQWYHDALWNDMLDGENIYANLFGPDRSVYDHWIIGIRIRSTMNLNGLVKKDSLKKR